MIRQIDLARRWGLSRSRICQMVREGLPLDSADEADAWRAGKFGAPAATSAPAPGPAGLSTDREDLSGVLARAISAELEAWRALQSATAANSDATPVARMSALKHYHASATLRVQTEQALADVRVNTGQLVEMGVAHEAIARVLDPLRVSLRAMPRAVASRANPSDPELARVAVEEAVDQIMAQIHSKQCKVPSEARG